MDNFIRRGRGENITVLEQQGASFFRVDVRNLEDLGNLPSVVTGYANSLFDITNNGLGAIHILEYTRTRRISLIFWSSYGVYGVDRLNALALRETLIRFEHDADAWNRLPVEQRPAGVHPVHDISEEYSIEG